MLVQVHLHHRMHASHTGKTGLNSPQVTFILTFLLYTWKLIFFIFESTMCEDFPISACIRCERNLNTKFSRDTESLRGLFQSWDVSVQLALVWLLWYWKIKSTDIHRGTASLTLKSTIKACHALHFPMSSEVWLHLTACKNMTISMATVARICFGLSSWALKQFTWWTSK